MVMLIARCIIEWNLDEKNAISGALFGVQNTCVELAIQK